MSTCEHSELLYIGHGGQNNGAWFHGRSPGSYTTMHTIVFSRAECFHVVNRSLPLYPKLDSYDRYFRRSDMLYTDYYWKTTHRVTTRFIMRCKGVTELLRLLPLTSTSILHAYLVCWVYVLALHALVTYSCSFLSARIPVLLLIRAYLLTDNCIVMMCTVSLPCQCLLSLCH